MGVMQHPATIRPAPAVMAILSRFDRQQVEAFITVAIDLLDTMDGNPDVEDDDQDTGVEDGAFDPEEDLCPAGDDGCGPVVQHGVVRWGAADEDTSRLPIPRYGIDQSRGPIEPNAY